MTVRFEVVSERGDNDLGVIALSGEVDIYTAPQFKARLNEMLDDGVKRLVVDLSDVDFIDSTALGVLIGGVRSIRAASGQMALVVATRPVERVLSITGLDRVFAICDTREDALKTFD
jgi:anti-sigma B factor antagonist